MDPRTEMLEQALEARFGQRNPKHPVNRARRIRAQGVQGRPLWPKDEPNPWDQDTEGKTVEDTCPPWTYPISIPGPPPEFRQRPLAPLAKPEQLKVDHMAREVGREAATYVLNPYIFPTPFSQDFDIFGRRSVTAVTSRFLITRFQLPRGTLGIFNAAGVEVEPALQSFTAIGPEVNDSIMKDFNTIVVTGYSTPALTPGAAYCFGPLCNPRELFHPIVEEGSLGMSVNVAAGGGALLPSTISAVIRGRYWLPTVATRFWNYVKG